MSKHGFRNRAFSLTQQKNNTKNFDNMIRDLEKEKSSLKNTKIYLLKNLFKIISVVILMMWTIYVAQKPVFGVWQYSQFVIIFIVLMRIIFISNRFNSRVGIFKDFYDYTSKGLNLMKYTYVNNLSLLIGICEKGALEETSHSKESKLEKIHELAKEMRSLKLNISSYGGCKDLFCDSMYKDVKEFLDYIDKITYIENFINLSDKDCALLLEDVCNKSIKIEKGMIHLVKRNLIKLREMSLEINSLKHYFIK